VDILRALLNPMKSSGLLRLLPFCTAGACVVTGLAAATESAQRLAFRSVVDLVRLNVTVTDSAGRHISDLSAADFTVFEDRRPQTVTFFAQANTALTVSLLIDTSYSMRHQLPIAQKAASEFIARLRPGDVAEVVDIDSHVAVMQPLTSDRNLLTAAIQKLHVGGMTSLFNAVYISLRQLEKLKVQTADDVRRQVIVLLSDGDDTSSLVTFDELLDATKRSETAIYAISLRSDEPAGGTVPPNGEHVLRSLSTETGGRLFTTKSSTDLSNIYNQIADELTSQYVLGYASSNERRDGGWRAIVLRLRRPELRARTRSGYYAPAR
jgi:Ca-activated chloride channel homolog